MGLPHLKSHLVHIFSDSYSLFPFLLLDGTQLGPVTYCSRNTSTAECPSLPPFHKLAITVSSLTSCSVISAFTLKSSDLVTDLPHPGHAVTYSVDACLQLVSPIAEKVERQGLNWACFLLGT